MVCVFYFPAIYFVATGQLLQIFVAPESGYWFVLKELFEKFVSG